MTRHFFVIQISRMAAHFKNGEQHFSGEFQQLAYKEVSEMLSDDFKKWVDYWIGEHTVWQPPAISAFREAMHQQATKSLNKDSRGAGKKMAHLWSAQDKKNAGNLRARMKKRFGTESMVEIVAMVQSGRITKEELDKFSKEEM